MIYVSFLVYLGSLSGKLNTAISITEVSPTKFKTVGGDYPEAYRYITKPEDDSLFDAEFSIVL